MTWEPSFRNKVQGLRSNHHKLRNYVLAESANDDEGLSMRFVTSAPDSGGNALEPSREEEKKKTRNCRVCVVLYLVYNMKAERKEKSSNSSLSHNLECFHRMELVRVEIGDGK